MPGTGQEDVAIVGGGIAGLFCALVLQDRVRSVHLFETAERLGGRIRTIRLDNDNKPLNKNWTADKLEFYVEFGPMRIELDKQLLLKALLTHLGITKPVGPDGRNRAHLVDFPAYASPTSAHDPQYELRPEEEGKAPLQLLKMALLRVLLHLEVDGPSRFAGQKEALVKQVLLAAATGESVERVFTDWIKGQNGQTSLNEQHYWEIQTRGQIGGVHLYQMGFWNLLSDYLSHNATTKLRDLGTFYHLLPENPNAAEWVVWWLLGFAISERMQGIFGGMECIVDELENRLTRTRVLPNCWVKQVQRTSSNRMRLLFDEKKRPADHEVATLQYDRVILALPKSAVQDIERQSGDVFTNEPDIAGLLDSAFGFPMVKTFVVVKDRWWENENRANRYATRIPTRELHYWRGNTKDSTQGLIMAYTDNPASAFWANYVPAGPQIDAHRTLEKELPPALRDRLLRKITQYLGETDRPEISPDDLIWYGIRDWGRDPYGGANHAWRTQCLYWVVMRRLADIPVAVDPATKRSLSSIHVCGEAYSDYHGFMEGSLRSAALVLHRILDARPDGTFDRLPWLLEEGASPDKQGLRVQKEYLASLREWARQLCSFDCSTPFIPEEPNPPREANP